ncbi:hypothetical protein ATE84_1141 [Aquimarina sp. MAR_2010_214]|uniref:hypothetical protein n=1 Tax=Aquimarina sp. MAR_2010_214 TaxID=1250026 RepID=UPI000C70EF49|nr:hypothetical protein [Aquimarina sp. MAR_2010_214]PKV49124.1 hypothetical protein ATE84_1141 [Aquimarina sp. MAR_2010_214]
MDKTQESSLAGCFQLDKSNYCINENIWLDFSIENTSKKEVYVFFQKEEPEEIKIEVKESKGYAMNSNKQELGISLLPEYELKPGKELSTKYLLNHWIEFEKKGIYTITVSINIEYNGISIKSNQSKDLNKTETITSIISLEITE